MKYKFILSFFVLCSLKLFSQYNLVVNGSFEEITKCPGYKFHESSSTILKGWNSYSTVGKHIYEPCIEVLNSCAVQKYDKYWHHFENEMGKYKGVPQNYYGYQQAHTGNGYVMLRVINAIPLSDKNNETLECSYLQSELRDSLKGGKRYYLEFFVTRCEKLKFYTNGLGACVTREPLIVSTGRAYEETKAQVQNNPQRNLKDAKNWVKISGYFIANGGEKYIAVGNFLQIEDIRINKKPVSKYRSNYTDNFSYFIDSVSLYEVDENGLPVIE